MFNCYKNYLRNTAWFLVCFLCFLSPTLAYINNPSVSSGNFFYTIYYEGSEVVPSPLQKSNLRAYKPSLTNSLDIIAYEIIQQENIKLNIGDMYQIDGCYYSLFDNPYLRANIVNNYKSRIGSSYNYPENIKVYCFPFGNGYNDGSSIVPATIFSIKMVLWPRSQSVNSTIYDYFYVISSEAALQVGVHGQQVNGSMVYDEWNQGETQDLVLINDRSLSYMINRDFFYIYHYSYGQVDIKGHFGNTSPSSISVLNNTSSLLGFPFLPSDLDYIKQNAGYSIANTGYSTAYNRRTLGTMQEFFSTFYMMHLGNNTNLSTYLPMFGSSVLTISNTSIYTGWNYFDRDNGQEPDSSEFVNNHDRTDPLDDWTGEDNYLVDLGSDSKTFIDENTEALLDKLDEVKDAIETVGGTGGGGYPSEGIEEIKDELQRIYPEDAEEPPTDPNLPGSSISIPSANSLVLPDSQTELNQYLTSWRSSSIAGPFLEGIQSGSNFQEGPLPRVELPISTQYGGSEKLYMDFNELLDTSEYRVFFIITKGLITLAILGFMSIWLVKEVSDIIKG